MIIFPIACKIWQSWLKFIAKNAKDIWNFAKDFTSRLSAPKVNDPTFESYSRLTTAASILLATRQTHPVPRPRPLPASDHPPWDPSLLCAQNAHYADARIPTRRCCTASTPSASAAWKRCKITGRRSPARIATQILPWDRRALVAYCATLVWLASSRRPCPAQWISSQRLARAARVVSPAPLRDV